MNDLARIERAMRKATRGLLWANVTLPVVFAAAAVLGQFVSGQGADAGGAARASGFAREDEARITGADVERATTGKMLFRTSATALREKVVDELAHYELKGVSMRKGCKQAHVRDTKLKRLVTKKVGDALGPYEVIDITDEGITVKRGAETFILSKG